LAVSKNRKKEIVAEYTTWIKRSQAMILAEYKGLPMAELDILRGKMRETGGEFHIVKNTLGQLAFKEAGLPLPEKLFEGSTAIGFAFEDAPAVAKMLTEYMRNSDFLKIKGGYLGTQVMDPDQVKSLADLPPLPVVRAQLLSTLLASSGRIARTLAEPGRRVAAILKAYAEREAAPEQAKS
jgi:large subunit ribosomal protein L10